MEGKEQVRQVAWVFIFICFLGFKLSFIQETGSEFAEVVKTTKLHIIIIPCLKPISVWWTLGLIFVNQWALKLGIPTIKAIISMSSFIFKYYPGISVKAFEVLVWDYQKFSQVEQHIHFLQQLPKRSHHYKVIGVQLKKL